MDHIVVWGVDWVPPAAQGLVRDLRVRWALEEAGFAYATRSIGAGDRNAEPYLRKHPFGKVPVFESSAGTLFESGAIVHVIAEQTDALMPPALRNETLAWMFAALNTVEPPLWNLLEIDLLHPDAAWATLRRPTAVDAAKARLHALSEWMQDREHLLERFTAADILMVTVLRFVRHTDLIAGFPRLAAYVQRCEARPAFQAALQRQLADYADHAPRAA